MPESPRVWSAVAKSRTVLTIATTGASSRPASRNAVTPASVSNVQHSLLACRNGGQRYFDARLAFREALKLRPERFAVAAALARKTSIGA